MCAGTPARLGHHPHLAAHILVDQEAFSCLSSPQRSQASSYSIFPSHKCGETEAQRGGSVCPHRVPPQPPHLRLRWPSRPALTGCVSSGQLLTLSRSWFLHRRKGVGMPLSCWARLIGRKQGDNGSPGWLAGTSSSLPPPPSRGLEGLQASHEADLGEAASLQCPSQPPAPVPGW